MATIDPWTTIHEERRALLQDLEPLTAQQWATPSLCEGWTVQDVLGHMIAAARKTPPKFFAGMIGSGFRFNAMAAKDVAREAQGGPAETLARFREVLDRTSSPPGPKTTWIGEVVVHGEEVVVRLVGLHGRGAGVGDLRHPRQLLARPGAVLAGQHVDPAADVVELVEEDVVAGRRENSLPPFFSAKFVVIVINSPVWDLELDCFFSLHAHQARKAMIQ